MRRAALKTKRTIAVFTLALASCRSPIQSPTNTPQVIPLRIIATSSTAPLLQELTTAYSLEHLTIPVVQAIANNEEAIIGRDVLNKLLLTLNGPAHMTEIQIL
jgi:hypothetical protein